MKKKSLFQRPLLCPQSLLLLETLFRVNSCNIISDVEHWHELYKELPYTIYPYSPIIYTFASLVL